MRIRRRPQIPACSPDLEKTSHGHVGDCRAGAPLRVAEGDGVLHSDEGDLPIEINGCNVDGSVGSSDGVAGRDLKPSPSDLRRPMGSRVVSRVDDGKVTKNKGTNWILKREVDEEQELVEGAPRTSTFGLGADVLRMLSSPASATLSVNKRRETTTSTRVSTGSIVEDGFIGNIGKTQLTKKSSAANAITTSTCIDGNNKPVSKRKNPAVLMEGSRCSRVNGRGWRCCQQTLVGYSLCEHHLGKGRLRSVSGVKSSSSNNSMKNKKKKKQKYDESDIDMDEEEIVKKMRGKRRKIGVVKARSISSLLDQTNLSPVLNEGRMAAAAAGQMSPPSVEKSATMV